MMECCRWMVDLLFCRPIWRNQVQVAFGAAWDILVVALTPARDLDRAAARTV